MVTSPSPTGSRPVERLAGLTLEDGWVVTQMIVRPPGSTGGTFSVGYLAMRGSEMAYVKALDFMSAFQSANWTDKMQEMLEEYHYERDTSLKLSGIRRVVTAKGHGSVDVPGFFPPTNKVPYMILELAEGDIRGSSQYSDTSSDTIAVKLRSLHNVADGLNHMHVAGVAHQDLKPSNIFTFTEDECKIGDLGCSSDRSSKSPNDRYFVAGDPGYLPPEYGYATPVASAISFNNRRSLDLYLLGSLFFFAFRCGASARSELLHSVQRLGYTLTGAFEDDEVIYRSAFGDVMQRFSDDLMPIAPNLTPKIVSIVRELCHPIPAMRGNPKRSNLDRRICVQRYVSLIDHVAKRAEYGML